MQCVKVSVRCIPRVPRIRHGKGRLSLAIWTSCHDGVTRQESVILSGAETSLQWGCLYKAALCHRHVQPYIHYMRRGGLIREDPYTVLYAVETDAFYY